MFKFGENWREYAEHALTEGAIAQAKTALSSLLGMHDLSGLTFFDIGCGSGLHATAAALLGADAVYACDIDVDSVVVTERTLDRLLAAEQRLRISVWQDSILAMKQHAPATDIVYSWGVLHHTGQMYSAIRAASAYVKPGGLFVIAIYNRHITSALWLQIKRVYNLSPEAGKRVLYHLFYWIIFGAKFAAVRENPLKKERGMNFGYDVIDWIGGYPYEYASIEDIKRFVEAIGFQTERVIPAEVGTGCNEFVFRSIY